MDEYRVSVEEILKANRLGNETPNKTLTVRTMSMKEIYSVPVHLDAVTLTIELPEVLSGQLSVRESVLQ